MSNYISFQFWVPPPRDNDMYVSSIMFSLFNFFVNVFFFFFYRNMFFFFIFSFSSFFGSYYNYNNLKNVVIIVIIIIRYRFGFDIDILVQIPLKLYRFWPILYKEISLSIFNWIILINFFIYTNLIYLFIFSINYDIIMIQLWYGLGPS